MSGWKRVGLVARTEVKEQLRQRAMLGVMVGNYVLWNLVFVVVLVVLNSSRENAQALALLGQQALSLGICDGESALRGIVRLTTSTFGAVMFTTMLVFVAMSSGYSVLNDRLQGTMPFLMLAPLSRYQLVFGKVLGVMWVPFVMHVVFVGGTSFAVSGLEVVAPLRGSFGHSAAWWVAFLLGAPAAGFLVGSLGTVISGLARDVRTSMQYTSFFIGILSLGFGHVLFDRMTSGVGLELAFAVGSGLVGLGILWFGSRIISRDLT